MTGDSLAPFDAEQIIDSLEECILLVGPGRRILRANRRAVEMAGNPPGGLEGLSCADVVNSEACRGNCPLERVMESGKGERQFDIVRHTHEGGEARICLTSHPLRDSGGSVVGLVETLRDVGHIHELLIARDELNRGIAGERNRIRSILDSISEGVYTVDSNWKITSFNSAAQAITGYSENQALGRECREILRSSLCSVGCPLRETLTSGQPRMDVQGEIQTRDGDRRGTLFSTAVLRDHAGQAVGGVESIRDLGLLEDLLARVPARLGSGVIGTSPAMLRISGLLDLVRDSDATVLFTGESGTGKSLLAQELHRRSKRRDRPFMKVSCAALAEGLLESELFGHVRGAFTGATQDRAGRFEAANGGTVFLDEIGEIAPATQIKLLRFVQDQEFERVGSSRTVRVDVRLVAATNRDLVRLVREGAFREDLYYRLAVIPVHVPPLRERREDIPALVAHGLKRLSGKAGGVQKALAPEVMGLFARYAWPGNIRELENVLEHGFVCTPGSLITLSALPEHFLVLARNGEAGAGRGQPEDGRVENLAPQATILSRDGELERVQEALRRSGGRMGEAAALLGVDRTTLWRRMRRLGLRS